MCVEKNSPLSYMTADAAFSNVCACVCVCIHACFVTNGLAVNCECSCSMCNSCVEVMQRFSVDMCVVR
jgi:hypothetical protein